MLLVFSSKSTAAKTFATNFHIGDISIYEVWARSSFSMAKSASAYMTLKNASGEIEKLISVKSPIAKRVEIHQTESEDGVMKMRLVNILNIPAKSITMLKPGGKHVMFFGLSKPLREGSYFPLILEFMKSGKVKIMVKVLKYKSLDYKKRKHHKH